MATWIPSRPRAADGIFRDELTIHYGLLPRANRGIFAINELPDLAGKIQVGLFNIMQEGDVQIKGYPVRLRAGRAAGLHREPGGLHGARQNHHAAEGPHRLGNSHALSGDGRRGHVHHRAGIVDRTRRRSSAWKFRTTSARSSRKSPFRRAKTSASTAAPASASGLPISALENVLSSAEQRAVRSRDSAVVARVADVYAAIPAMTGKFELEYEGELRGADNIARELIRAAVGKTFTQYFTEREFAAGDAVVRMGRELKIPANASSSEVMAQLKKIQGLFDN